MLGRISGQFGDGLGLGLGSRRFSSGGERLKDGLDFRGRLLLGRLRGSFGGGRLSQHAGPSLLGALRDDCGFWGFGSRGSRSSSSSSVSGRGSRGKISSGCRRFPLSGSSSRSPAAVVGIFGGIPSCRLVGRDRQWLILLEAGTIGGGWLDGAASGSTATAALGGASTATVSFRTAASSVPGIDGGRNVGAGGRGKSVLGLGFGGLLLLGDFAPL